MSWRLVALLAARGIGAIHVRDLGLAHASDGRVLMEALDRKLVLVTMDGDFARMMAATGDRQPSILFLRTQLHQRPNEQASRLVAVLRRHAKALRTGAVVVVRENDVRVRALPLGER